MGLKIFNAETSPRSRMSSTEPGIGIDYKSGSFRFNKSGADLLGLKKDSQVQFAQDDEDPKKWFITVPKESGFMIRIKSNGSFIFSNAGVAREILASGGAPAEKSGRIILLAKSIKMGGLVWWPLDLSQLKKRKQ
ncbi:MAG TPA: hypothetical protein VK618_06750 [Flavitalea sp.]|nr:hypothetical protein [Flavitalea sp.]